MDIKSNEYQNHKLFFKIKYYQEFYQSLSDLIFSFCTMGTNSLGNIDSYVYSSIEGTLSSIEAVLKIGRINDAYALLRKYYDSIYINIYTILYLEDHFSVDNFTVKQIQGWLEGLEQIPSTRTISDYIRKHKKILDLNNLLYKDKRYSDIRDRCNDNAHYNFYKNVLLNDNKIHNPQRRFVLDQLSSDLSQLMLMHISYLFYISQHYMASSDYLDHLEVGYTPPNGSQYWVAPFIQNIFNDLIKVNRMDIASLIKEKTSMQLD